MKKTLRAELKMLQKEEIAVRELMDRYKKALISLQIEEMTIRDKLGAKQDLHLKPHTSTYIQADVNAYHQLQSSQVLGNATDNLEPAYEIGMNELQINQSTLSLDATPLINRILQDSDVCEEEEEDEEENRTG